jgi:hypothetical protein
MNKKNGLFVDDDGNRNWYVNGLLHRSDGPAVERANGSCEWWVNGQLHRSDGPAIEWANGGCEWWVNGQQLKFADWIGQLNCSDRERLVFLLKYSHKESVA